jgi:hypothetical protein
VSVTGIDTGELPIPEAETVMLPVYVPDERPVASTETLITPGVLPALELIWSQDEVELAVQLNVPTPAFDIVRLCGAGLP